MRYQDLRWLNVIAIVMLALPVFSTQRSVAQANCRTFTETGHQVCGTFVDYWTNNGALAQQGYPVTDPVSEVSDTDGKIYTVQYFERAVFEEHPELQGSANEVLLQLLGVFFYQSRYPYGAAGQIPSSEANAQLFPETGHKVGGIFLTYWTSHGGLRQQGYPISDEFIEVNQLDGRPYKVQYFERAVFEYHPEFAGTSNEVLLSQLGTFQNTKKHQYLSQSTPAPVAPTAIPVPAQPTPIPAQPTPVPVQPTPTTPTNPRPPSDVSAFASYILQRYPNVGDHVLQIDSTFAQTVGGIHAISFDLGLGSIDYMLHHARAADVRAWGDAVFAEAKQAWPNEDFSVELAWSGYTYDPCFECSDSCYYVSDDYTSGRGWYYSYTIVRAYRYTGISEGVTNCVQ